MSRLAYPFWNAEERRPRALWRLLLQVVLLLIGLLVLALLALPFSRGPHGEWVVGSGTSLLIIASVGLAGRLIDRRPITDFGLYLDRAWWHDCCFGLGLGLLMMVAVFAAAAGAGWITLRVASSVGTTWFALALPAAFLDFVLVSVSEELLSRGYQLRNLAEGLHGRLLGQRGAILASMVLTSAVFAALHLPGPHTTRLSILNTLLGGVLLGVALVFTGRLGLSIGVHTTWNFAQGCLFGLPVSGNPPRAALLDAERHGPEIWIGGAYGPEGGLLATGAFLLAIVITLAWVRARYGKLRLRTSMTQYISNR